MALLSFQSASDAQSFAETTASNSLVSSMQQYSWCSYDFGDKQVWPSSVLLRFLYRLAGGRFEIEERLDGPEGQKSSSKELIKDDTLYESFDAENDEVLIAHIKTYYLGPTLSVGSAAGCTVAKLISRVCRFWYTSSDEADGRAKVGGCLDGFTFLESSGTSLRLLAVLLHRLGIASKLGPFCGSGVQAGTSKRRLLHFFYEHAQPSTVNGLICLASSPEDCMALFASHWNGEFVQELETPEAVALCNALGLSPTTSGSAPRLLSLTLAGNRSVEGSEAGTPAII